MDPIWETTTMSQKGEEVLRRVVLVALDDLFMPDRVVYSPKLDLADKAVYSSSLDLAIGDDERLKVVPML